MRTFIVSVIMIIATNQPLATNASPLNQWGFKAGYTAAKQIWEDELRMEDLISFRSGIHIGVFADWFDYRGLSLSTGVQYEQKGMNCSLKAIDQSGEELGEVYTTRLHYLTLPVLLKYSMRGSLYGGYFMAGPRLDYYLGHSDKVDFLDWGIIDERDMDLEDEFNDFVFGLSFGFGIERKVLASRKIFIEFMYNYDPFFMLTDYDGFKIKNQSFNISAGIGF